MLSGTDNEFLVRTGAGSAMGEYFRRFWLPVALSRELPEPDCTPLRVQVMGECLVAFRDTQGCVGLVEPRVRASRRRPFLWPQRARRPALHLPRLEVRRRRQMHRDAQRAAGCRLPWQDLDQGIPDPRSRRYGLGLPRPARADAAGAARARDLRAAGIASLRLQAPAAMQLGAIRSKARSIPRTSRSCICRRPRSRRT